MDINLEPGVYVVAVSGGVDSVVLLDMLVKTAKRLEHHVQRTERDASSSHSAHSHKLIVAHFDHGIREHSVDDRHFVQQLALQYNLPFVYHEGRLGPDASEAEARRARYEFLHKVRVTSAAEAVITAHHQDDVIETAILNLLRGTGRKGLTSLRSGGNVIRPLLDFPKADILAYAYSGGLSWHEDPTNLDTRFKRNYIRHKIIPNLFDGNYILNV